MKVLLVLFALGVAVSATPYQFDHDIKIDVYDVFKALFAAAPISKYYNNDFAKGSDFTFSEEFFNYYPEDEIREFVVVFKPTAENYLDGYYVKTEDVSKYDDDFFTAVHPIYEYLNSGEYYAFTPLAAKAVIPSYFNLPLKKIFYDYYSDVDVDHDIPLVFLVPKSEVNQAALEDLVHIAEYKVTKDGSHVVNELYDAVEKPLVRRDVVYPYTDPYFTSYPYYNSYVRAAYPYYNAYPSTGYQYYGYPGLFPQYYYY